MATFKKNICIFFGFAICFLTFGQGGFSIIDDDKFEKIRFDFVNNLIVLPVEVNGAKLSFILDTGVNTPILFNITESDSVNVHNTREIYIRGLGDGEPIKAIHSEGNVFKLGNVVNYQQDFYLITDSDINFSPRIGYKVHGIIGYDLLKDFVVDIDYGAERLKLYDPDQYDYDSCRKCETLPLTLEGSKAYVHANIKQYTAIEEVKVKLLLDSGSCDALWLFENNEHEITGPMKFFDDFLGFGLSGKIHGKRARVQRFSLAGFELPEAKVAYPNEEALQFIDVMQDRNGSLGSEILRRFDLVIDYPNQKITFKKNRNFKDPFKYNMSGIELQHNGLRLVKALMSDYKGLASNANFNQSTKIYLQKQFDFELHPALEIAEVREGSPASEVGLRPGDVILKVNNRYIHKYSLQEVSEMINEKEGKLVRLLVDRKGSELKFAFELQKML
ncbi:PDZ domain-containing protein [Galbibacter mesophilus]|uniref:PDZ domain-containing protein n=1 Tax=Galbibacter mesophilus TaxID=379069 RepID=UPI00191FD3AE|nr:PDZ domain-containing protein [Galbibacter mesophilus]MCM5664379.1 PDZ domain-containing protein [Galbibacter mesophilus]